MTKSKVLKRISAFLLMVVMMLAMAVPAMAQTNKTGSATEKLVTTGRPTTAISLNMGQELGNQIARVTLYYPTYSADGSVTITETDNFKNF